MNNVDTDLPAKLVRPLYVGAVGVVTFIVAIVALSITVPLATTIQVSGVLVSSSPSFEVQHPYGGTISWVGVKAHQSVRAGEVLFRFDTRLERSTLMEIEAQTAILSHEISLIDIVLAGNLPTNSVVSPSRSREKYIAEEEALQAQVQALLKRAAALQAKARSTLRELEYLSEKHAIMADALAKQQALQERGLTRENDVNLLRSQVLDIAEELSEKTAQRATVASQAEQSRQDVIRLRSQRHADLLVRRRDNVSTLSQLRIEQLRQQAIIDAADIRSPIDGQVQALFKDTAGMYVPKGETLVEIAEMLQKPVLQLNVPVNVVDQVRVDMRGRLTIASLPQREMPVIYVTLTAVAPLAERDREGRPTSYLASAEIEDLSAFDFLESTGVGLRLSADMPVSVALQGRSVTFASYAVKPFLSAFSGALQD